MSKGPDCSGIFVSPWSVLPLHCDTDLPTKMNMRSSSWSSPSSSSSSPSPVDFCSATGDMASDLCPLSNITVGGVVVIEIHTVCDIWLCFYFVGCWMPSSTSCWCGTTALSPSGRASSSAMAQGLRHSHFLHFFNLNSEFWRDRVDGRQMFSRTQFFSPTNCSVCCCRIRGWWVFHHYVSTFLSGVMLTWWVVLENMKLQGNAAFIYCKLLLFGTCFIFTTCWLCPQAWRFPIPDV